MLTRSLFAIIAAAALHPAVTQAPPPPAVDREVQKADQAATLAKVTALRDAFVARIHAAGLTCLIAPPNIVIEDVPSFGNYEDSDNTLRTGDWYKLTPEERAVFFKIAGPGSSEKAAHMTFEGIAHKWIFIHELGHWWQACQHAISRTNHYAVEYGANRIAAAYWRENDPAFAKRMANLFTGLYEHSASPLPAGQSIETYFNEHYNELGPTPAYRWYQEQMNAAVFAEKPALTFDQALAKPTK